VALPSFGSNTAHPTLAYNKSRCKTMNIKCYSQFPHNRRQSLLGPVEHQPRTLHRNDVSCLVVTALFFRLLRVSTVVARRKAQRKTFERSLSRINCWRCRCKPVPALLPLRSPQPSSISISISSRVTNKRPSPIGWLHVIT